MFAGKNTIVLAPTAGGKTEAAFFPVLDLLHSESVTGVGCIYVSPLRALLNNQEARVQQLARMVSLDAFKWHGDVGAGPRNRFLQNPTSVLMTTPESLEVLLMGGQGEQYGLFRQIRFAIVDEIHAFAVNDRGAHLMAILERIQGVSNYDIQRLGLSATVGNPEDLARWMQGTSKRGYTVVDPPRSPAKRKIAIRYTEGGVDEATASAAPMAYGRKSIFFTQGRAATELVRQAFKHQGVEVFVHHSSVSRDLREEAEGRFMGVERAATMVSTSTLELGIDVGELDIVFQLDAPSTVSSFLQRMGRTGRREGKNQHIEFFTTSRDSLLQAVALVNLARRGFVERIAPSSLNFPVFLHQMLAQIVERTAMRKGALWKALQGPAPFRDIDKAVFEAMIDHLLEKHILEMVDHRLVFGEEGERLFGGMNFFNLYAVFETPGEIVVKTNDGHVIGTLETTFVRRMKDNQFTFLLAGRTWQAVDVDLNRSLVVAIPYSGGEAPRWHSAGGFLGFEVAEEMRNVLISEEELTFVDNGGREEIQRMRKELAPILSSDRCPMTWEKDKMRIYTYAGGRINATIAALVEEKGAAEVSGFGDLDIVLRDANRNSPDPHKIQVELRKLRDADKHMSRPELARLVSEKQRGKLAKFQPYLPPNLEGAYLSERLFDVPGASGLARKAGFEIC